ncbi:somatostatin 2 isoform X2 [Carassius auratus]|uniref:Somatostatin 2 isoform X2 n=1 Tax=Carassius auratus TaxID=7957 RepID=A0A6P6P2R8_CARAU|nr:somatostatin-2-like isoform X2 [Carassius auratus]XP_052464960.1 somatostatin 2 isoform X2 [Carassius gibelio]
MASPQLHLTVYLICLAMAASIISCGRSHMDTDSTLEASRGSAADEVLQWLLSNSNPAAIQSDSPSLGILQKELDLMRRDSGDKRKPGCMNYFWKSKTAC